MYVCMLMLQLTECVVLVIMRIYGTDLMQVHTRARVRSRVRALMSSIQHVSVSASMSTITHASKLT